jgi:hypothetical protein
MPRHADFAAVATIRGEMVNASLAAYCRSQLGPFFFPLPTTIGSPPYTVTFSGVMEMLPPEVELQPNPGNLVAVRFTFQSKVRAQFGQQPTQTFMVQLADTVNIGIIAVPQNERLVIGIDTQQVVFQPLQVQVLAGPALPALVLNALQSATLAAAATAFVQSLPPITASPPLLSSQINFSQPSPGPWYTGEWFTIKLSASNIAIRILEDAVSVGVDMWGYAYSIDAFDQKVPTSETFFTSGDANSLVDLTAVKGKGHIYKQHFTQMEVDPFSPLGSIFPPLLSLHPEPKGGSIAVAVNFKFLTDMVAKQISPQIRQPPISVSPHPQITIESIGIGYSTFDTFDGTQDGLAIKFKVGVDEGPGFEVDGKIFL